MKYLRFGECKHCGFCCMNKRCEHFKWENGEAVCSVWGNGSMPQECREYPVEPPVLTENCGYRFVDVKRRVKLEARQA